MMKGMIKFKQRGFTLIELLVVVAIIAILSVIGITVFTGAQSRAKDAKIRADLNAIKKAYEASYNPLTNAYRALAGTDFADGKIPKKPDNTDYICTVGPSGCTNTSTSGFSVTDNTTTPTFTVTNTQGSTTAVADAAKCPTTYNITLASDGCKVQTSTGISGTIYICPTTADVVCNGGTTAFSGSLGTFTYSTTQATGGTTGSVALYKGTNNVTSGQTKIQVGRCTNSDCK